MAIEIDVQSKSQAAQKDLDALEKKLGKVGASAQKLSREDFKALSSSVETINGSIKGLGDKLNNLAVGLSTLVAATAGIATIAKATDSFARMSNKIKVTTGNIDEYNRALLDTRRIAIETGQSLEDITTLYTKLNFASKSFGATQGQVAKVTETVSKALAASGATAAERSSAILQLGQAMSSAFVQGDELRTLREAAPFLIKTVADNMKVSVGEIKKLGEQGILSSDVFFNALLEGSEEANTVFGKMSATYEKAFTTFGTGVDIFLKQFALAFGSGDLVESVDKFAKSFAKAAVNFDTTLLRMRIKFWIFISNLEEGFRRAPNLIKEGMKTISSAFSNISIPSINLDEWIPKLEPMKKQVLAWVKTVERGFFWLYDEVIGHSWIPDLVLGVIDWMKKLLDKPLSYAKTFAEKVNNLFAGIKGPTISVNSAGLAAGIMVAGVAGLTTAFMSGSIIKTLAVTIGTAALMAFSQEANALVSTIAAVFTSAIALFAGNPVIKLLFGAIGTVFTASAISSQSNISKAIGEAVFEGLRFAFDKITDFLYGSSVFGERPFAETLGLLLKIALLFSAGRAAFLDAAKGLAGAGNAFGKNIGDRFEKSMRSKQLASWEDKLKIEEKILKRNETLAKQQVNSTRQQLAGMQSASGQTLGNAGLRQFDIARNSANPAAFSQYMNSLSTQAKATAQQLMTHNQNLTRVVAENQRLESTRIKGLREAISSQKAQVARLGNSLQEASLRMQNGVGNAAGGVAGIFGAFAGYNIGRKIADDMAESPAWVKTAVPLATAFTGQMLASGIGQLAGRFVYVLTVGFAGTIAKAFWTYITLPLVNTFVTKALIPMGAMLGRQIAAFLASSLAPVLLIPAAAIGLTVVLAEFGPTILEKMKEGSDYLLEKMKEGWDSFADWLNRKFNLDKNGDNVSKEPLKKMQETSVESRGWLGTAWDTISGAAELRASVSPAPISQETKDSIIGAISKGFEVRGGLIPSPTPQELSSTIKSGLELAFTSISGTAQASETPQNIDKLYNALLLQESGARHTDKDGNLITSSKGAQGISQVMPATGTDPGYGVKPLQNKSEEEYRRFGRDYLQAMLKEFNGNTEKALAAYNAGAGAVKDAVKAASREGNPDNWLSKMKEETRNYVPSILKKTGSDVATAPSVAESSVDRLKKVFKEYTPDFAKELLTAYEKGGLKGAFESIKTQLSSLFEYKPPETDDLNPKESKTKFQQMVDSAKTAEQALAAVNLKLRELNLIEINNLDFIKDEDFENFFNNLQAIDSAMAKLADPEIGYVVKRNLEAAVNELKAKVGEAARALALDNTKPGDKKSVWTVSQANIEDGANAAKNFTSQVSSGFAAALKGETSFSKLGEDLLMSFTGSILDAFSKSFIENLMKSSGLEDAIAGIFSNTFMIGEQSGKALGGAPGEVATMTANVVNLTAGTINGGAGSLFGMAGDAKSLSGIMDPFKGGKSTVAEFGSVSKDLVGGSVTSPGFGNDLFKPMLSGIEEINSAGVTAFSDVASSALTSFEGLGGSITGIFEGLGGSISGIFEGIMGMFGGGAGGIFSLFGFAEGGKIQGPGTGTSDSIMARVSNGEFIIKASQTKKYLPLLEAINSGKVPTFAAGGLVSTMPVAIPSVVASKQGSSSQTFNIQITGDISRQTKQEIYTMLPEIASGVNAHNREQGYKG